jgi:hypothetical protein
MVPKDDMCLIMKNILVLRDEHIECVNAVGIDEIPDVAFYVMSKGSEQYVQFTTDGTPYICQASFELFKMTHTTVSRPYVRKLHPEEHHPIRIDDNVW